jgi:hypothetical protein
MGVNNVRQCTELWMGAHPSVLRLDISLCDWIACNLTAPSLHTGVATSHMFLFKVPSIRVSHSFVLSFISSSASKHAGDVLGEGAIDPGASGPGPRVGQEERAQLPLPVARAVQRLPTTGVDHCQDGRSQD